jgi:hypothetical protein
MLVRQDTWVIVVVSSVNWFSPTRQGAVGIKFVRWLLEAGSVADFSTSSTRAEMTICGGVCGSRLRSLCCLWAYCSCLELGNANAPEENHSLP